MPMHANVHVVQHAPVSAIGPDVVRVVVVGHGGWDAARSLAAW